MHTLGFEFRHALRAIRQRPAISGIVVLTLALGLGANAAIFSMVDSLVVRPFTARDADRLVVVAYTRPNSIDRRQTVSPADFLDFRRQADVFERLSAFAWWNANLVGRDEPEHVPGFQVTADFFATLGVTMAAGRGFVADEETFGRHRSVVLGHGLWQRRFGGDAAIVGQPVQIDGLQYLVVGITPPGFDFPLGAQIWTPLAFSPATAALRTSRYLTPVGRLAPGRTLDDAKAQIAVIGERLSRQHPDTNRGFEARAYSLAQGMMDVGLGPVLSMLQASALAVLLIASANVASLLLARGAERQRDMAVRLAIGASRARVVRELTMEALVLGIAAVPVAVLAAAISLDLMRSSMPARIARLVNGWHQVDVDGRLILFTAALAIFSSLVFGLVSALQNSRPHLAESLKDGARGASVGSARVRLRRGLVVAEIALSLPLLVASGLSAASVHRFLNGPQGYDPDGVLVASLVLAEGRYPDDASRRRFAADAVAKLEAIGGVERAAVANVIPSAGSNWGGTVEIDGRPNPDPANPPRADYRVVTPAYFDTLRLPLVAGRGFTAQDRDGTQPVAIVSESFARRHWGDLDPLGRRVKIGTGPVLTVVGIAGNHVHDWFGRRGAPTVYRPFSQAPAESMGLLLRGRAPEALVADLRAAVRAIDPVQPVFDVMTMRDLLAERTLGLQYVAAIMGVFGVLALLLAAVGVYGLMAYTITQRTHEIGVRIALGATRGDVLKLTVGQTGRLTAFGVAVGVGLSIAAGRLIEAGLVGTVTADFRVIAMFAAVLIGAALAAGYFPARRAAATDPVVALRAQ